MSALDENNILYSPMGSKIRFVTHLHFNDSHLQKLVDVLKSIN